jgi:D-alanyl-D-alanine dipeptidase
MLRTINQKVSEKFLEQIPEEIRNKSFDDFSELDKWVENCNYDCSSNEEPTSHEKQAFRFFPWIPDLSEKRAGKSTYLEVGYDDNHPLKDDELVDPNDFGIKAQSYYYTLEGLRDNPDMATPLLRKDVVFRLYLADKFLRESSYVKYALGFNCKLEIRDCLRSLEMQEYAYNVYWPKRLKEQDPTLEGEELAAWVAKSCAKPNAEGPHISGGAVDIALINLETDKYVDRGTGNGRPIEANYPDYYEIEVRDWNKKLQSGDYNCPPPGEENNQIRLGRRILWYALTKIAGLEGNPTEIWHYGIGDKLWAYMSDNLAYYRGV